MGYASVREVIKPHIDAEYHQGAGSRIGWVFDDKEMEAGDGLASKGDPPPWAVRDANLIPDRFILRQRVERRLEIVPSKLLDSLGWNLGGDVIERGVTEPDLPHERRVARSAAACSSSGVRRFSASAAPGGSSSSGP